MLQKYCFKNNYFRNKKEPYKRFLKQRKIIFISELVKHSCSLFLKIISKISRKTFKAFCQFLKINKWRIVRHYINYRLINYCSSNFVNKLVSSIIIYACYFLCLDCSSSVVEQDRKVLSFDCKSFIKVSIDCHN